MTLQNEKFEELISQQLTRQLDPQRGRAAAAFRAQIAAETAQHAADAAAHTAGGSKDQQSWARRKLSRAGTLLWIAAPSAIAAALALAVTLHFTGTSANVTPPGGQNMIASRGPLDGEHGNEQLPRNDTLAVANNAFSLVEEQPGDVGILPVPVSNVGNSPIRPADYVEPVGHAYPLNQNNHQQ